MKIVVDLTSLADNFSGIERHAAELSHALLLADRSNSYVLVFKDSVHPYFEIFETSFENVTSIVLSRGKKGKLFFSQFILLNALNKIDADISLFFAFPAPFFYRKSYVSTIPDLCWYDVPETMLLKSRLFWKVLVKNNSRHSAALLTISQFSKSRILSVLKVPEEKVFVTYCGVDSSFFNLKNANSKNFGFLKEKYGLPDRYFLTLSTIEPRKNIALLVDAWCKACSEDAYIPDLVLAGRRGWKQEALLDHVPLELKPRVHFTGFVDDSDLPGLYGNSDLFVFPSIYEGFGLPPVEAAYCGAHVLCSDIPCLKEICGNGVAYFKNGDIDDLKRCLIDGVQRDDISGKIREYSWADSAKGLLQLIQEKAK